MSNKNVGSIRFGSCSWKYESWKGLIYPVSGKFNYLTEYSNHYNTVEIDRWFWSLFSASKVVLPQNKIVNEYKNSVPDNFLFTIKVPNSLTLTHFYRNNKSEVLTKNPHFLSIDLYNQFIESIRSLHKQIGCLIFQFEYLNKEKMPSQDIFQNLFYDFYEQVSKPTIQIGIEIRNANYLNNDFFNFLEELNIMPVMQKDIICLQLFKHVTNLKHI